MEFIIDKGGAVAARFTDTKYIHILPVTKYQFERFIWQTVPSWIDFADIIKNTGRTSPNKLTEKNIYSVFITNVSFEEAQEFCKWLSARLPTTCEWDEAYDKVFKEKSLFQQTLHYLQYVAGSQKIDQRIMKLLGVLIRMGVRRRSLEDISELVSEYPISPYGRIYLKHHNKDQALVTGSSPMKTKSERFGFCGVIEQ